MFVTKPNSHVYMCQGAIMPPDLAAQMRASMASAPGPCSDVFQSRDERQQRLVLKRNRLIQELSPKRLDGTTLRLRTPDGLYIAHRPATQDSSSREVVLRRPRSSPQGGRRVQPARPGTVAGLTTSSLPGAVTPTRLILAAAQAVRARSALAQDPGKPTQEPTSEPTIAAMRTQEGEDVSVSPVTEAHSYRPFTSRTRVTCSQPPLRIRPHSANGEGGLSAYFRALTYRSTRRLPAGQWGYSISTSLDKDPKFCVGKENRPQTRSSNDATIKRPSITQDKNDGEVEHKKQESHKSGVHESDDHKAGIRQMSSEVLEEVDDGCFHQPHGLAPEVHNEEVTILETKYVDEKQGVAAPTMLKPSLPPPAPPVVVGNGHILDRVNAAERAMWASGSTARAACTEPEKRAYSRSNSRASTPTSTRGSPPRGQIVTNTCKPCTPPHNSPTSKFDFQEALMARSGRVADYLPPPPSPRSVDTALSTTSISYPGLPSQCVATITVHKDSTFVLGDSVCSPRPQPHHSGRPSWPSAVDIQELRVGGFRYKPKSGDDVDNDFDSFGGDECEKDTTSPRGAIIVPSHTMLDCPLCNLYSEDGHEEHFDALSHTPVPSRSLGTPKPSTPPTFSQQPTGYKHKLNAARSSKSDRIMNKRHSIIVALSRPPPVATVKAQGGGRPSEAIHVPVAHAVQNGIRRNVFKYTYIKTPGGAGKAQVRTSELVQES